MAIPLVAWVATTLGAAVVALPESVREIGREEFARIIAGDLGEFEAAAMAAAFSKLGLEIDPENGLNATAITAAINAGPLASSGVELTNIFDREALKRDMKKVALVYAAEAFGFQAKGLTVEAIRAELKRYLSDLVIEQVGQGGGDLVDSAAELASIVALIKAARRGFKGDENGQYVPPDLDPSPAAQSNRERQARYRASHRKHWVLRGET